MSARTTWTREDVLALGLSVDVVTAAACWGIGASAARRLDRERALPFPVLQVGHARRVPTWALLRSLYAHRDDDDGGPDGPPGTRERDGSPAAPYLSLAASPQDVSAADSTGRPAAQVSR